MYRVELRIIAKHRVNNDVLDKDVLQYLCDTAATVSPAQIEIEKARIMAQMEIEKRPEQEIRISVMYNTQSSKDSAK